MNENGRTSSLPASQAHGPLRNTLLQLAAQFATAGFTAILTVFLVRKLGAAGYGIFVTALAVGTLAELPSDFGLPAAIARFVAERRHDPAAVSAILARGLQLKVCGAMIGSLALVAGAVPIADAYGHPGLVWPLRWVAIAIFGQGLLAFCSANFAALRNVTSTLKMVVCESVVETMASVALVAAGTGVTGAVLGRAVGYTFGGLVGLWLVRRITGPLRAAWKRRGIVSIRSIAGYAGAMMIVDVFHSAIAQIDILLVGAILGLDAAGQFGAVNRLYTFLTYLGISVASGVGPRLVRGGGGKPDARSFASGLRHLIVAQGLLLAPLVVWARPIISLVLGSGYRPSVEIMQALAPMVILGGLAPVLALGANYLGEARRRVPIMIVTLAVALVANYVLLRTIGLIGAAIADDFAFVVHVGAHFWLCRRFVELDLKELALTLLRTLLAASSMGVVLAALGTGHLSVPVWFAGVLVGPAAFGATLFLLREITSGDIRAWSGRLATAVGRARATSSRESR